MSNIDLLKDSPLYPILVKDAVKEAKAEERIRTLQEVARLTLEERFGALDGDLLAALDAANEKTLKAVAIHAGTETLEQLRKRLGLA